MINERDNAAIGREIAIKLRNVILAQDDGDYLGSEAELLAKLGVSRPTFRQAARILETEQLLRIRRGPKGGYFARKPSHQVVVQAVASYLTGEGVTAQQATTIFRSLLRDATISACGAMNTPARRNLKSLVDLIAAKSYRDSRGEYNEDIVKLVYCVYELAGNPISTLIIRVLFDLGLAKSMMNGLITDRERQKVWTDNRLNFARVILNGDVESALQFNRDAYDLIDEWTKEDDSRHMRHRNGSDKFPLRTSE